MHYEDSRSFSNISPLLPNTPLHYTHIYISLPTSLHFHHRLTSSRNISLSLSRAHICIITWAKKNMWPPPQYRKNDVESGNNRQLYPSMLESPELRWSFIRKVYSIVAIQLLLTIAVGAVVVSVHQISHFMVSTRGGLAVYIVLIITPFICTFFHILF